MKSLFPILLAAWLIPAATTSNAPTPSAARESSAAESSFSYSGDNGPGFWVEADPVCGGTAPSARQSPIDLVGAVVDPSLKALKPLLNDTSFTLQNNGHTLMAVPQVGGTLMLDGVTFTLAQFHFHTLSEHKISGKHAAMELHAVFKDPHSNFAVIGVLFKIGRTDPFLGKLLTAGLPRKTTSAPVVIERLNLSEGLTSSDTYYTYPGSLTTPPCSETVTWLVLKQQAQMSQEQFEAFRRILGNDFRPIQELNGRTIRVTPKRGTSEEDDQ
jgi:carbonic anhydrase